MNPKPRARCRNHLCKNAKKQRTKATLPTTHFASDTKSHLPRRRTVCSHASFDFLDIKKQTYNFVKSAYKLMNNHQLKLKVQVHLGSTGGGTESFQTQRGFKEAAEL